MHPLSLLFCTIIIQRGGISIVRCSLMLRNHRWMDKETGKRSRVIGTYIRWRTEDPFFLFGRCVSLFQTKVTLCGRNCVIVTQPPWILWYFLLILEEITFPQTLSFPPIFIQFGRRLISDNTNNLGENHSHLFNCSRPVYHSDTDFSILSSY